MLLAHGAKVDIASGLNFTPVHKAVKAQVGNCKIMNIVLSSDLPSVNLAGPQGNTALHMAAKEGDKKLCGLLLKFGAEAEARNENGKTAVEVADASGEKATSKYMKKKMKAKTTKRSSFVGTLPEIQMNSAE